MIADDVSVLTTARNKVDPECLAQAKVDVLFESGRATFVHSPPGQTIASGNQPLHSKAATSHSAAPLSTWCASRQNPHFRS